MIINALKVIQIFCELDDFTNAVEKFLGYKLLGSANPQSVHKPDISWSEMMCIEMLYHLSGDKCFPYYYQQMAEQGALKSYFLAAPSYSRFVQLKPRMLPLLIMYLQPTNGLL